MYFKTKLNRVLRDIFEWANSYRNAIYSSKNWNVILIKNEQ